MSDVLLFWCKDCGRVYTSVLDHPVCTHCNSSNFHEMAQGVMLQAINEKLVQFEEVNKTITELQTKYDILSKTMATLEAQNDLLTDNATLEQTRSKFGLPPTGDIIELSPVDMEFKLEEKVIDVATDETAEIVNYITKDDQPGIPESIYIVRLSDGREEPRYGYDLRKIGANLEHKPFFKFFVQAYTEKYSYDPEGKVYRQGKIAMKTDPIEISEQLYIALRGGY